MTRAASSGLRLMVVAACALAISACDSSSPPTTTGAAGAAGGTAGSGGGAGAGSDGGLCNGQICAADQFCCGPPACGYCARILQGPNCATTCN
jgi:hypothetical protein